MNSFYGSYSPVAVAVVLDDAGTDGGGGASGVKFIVFKCTNGDM